MRCADDRTRTGFVLAGLMLVAAVLIVVFA